MEGKHFVAGPWFTVKENGEGWHLFDTITVSNGAEHELMVRVEIRLRLEELNDEIKE